MRKAAHIQCSQHHAAGTNGDPYVCFALVAVGPGGSAVRVSGNLKKCTP